MVTIIMNDRLENDDHDDGYEQISQRSHSQLRERKTSAEEEERLQKGGSQLTKVLVMILCKI